MHVLIALLPSLASSGSPNDGTYRLRIDSVDPLLVSVEAELPSSNRLQMDDYGAWSLRRGWASLVRDLDVRDEAGDALAFAEDAEGWRASAATVDRLALSYTVNLTHLDGGSWPDGPRTTAGFRADDGAFALLGSLLVLPEEDIACQLVFEGENWGRVVVPFESDARGTFRMESLEQGVRNAVAFQVENESSFTAGDKRVQVVSLDQAAPDEGLMCELIEESLGEFSSLFGTQLEGQFVAIVYPDRWDTGEAYTDSFVLATTTPLTSSTLPIWGQSVAHEVFHHWLGRDIKGASWADSNWFSEGVTDYMASLFLVRTGYVTRDVFLDQLEKHAAFHRLYHKGPPFAGLDLVTAGADKGPNNAAIYDGGWLTAFAFDVELQERTRGRVGLEEFLRELLGFVGAVEGGYTIEDLESLLGEVSESDFGPFFARHVTAAEPLELVVLCERAGIDLALGAEQAHARIASNPSSAARRIRERVLAGPSNDSVEEIAAGIDALFEDYRAPGPGAAVTVWMEGEIVHSKGYGLADLERGQPNRPDTVFHAASISKQFTAFLVHLLAGEGRLSIDDPVRTWLPELGCAEDVRIRHLLDHTSGLRDQWQLLGLSGVRTDGDLITQDDVLRLLYRQEGLSFSPGSTQAYCNSGYTVLAEIAARAAGTPFPRLARERIFEPLGMARTFFQESPTQLVPDRALSYARKEAAFEPVPLAFGTHGATGLMTTTEDLIAWSRNRWEVRVGTREVLERMLERGILDDGTRVNFANGLHVRDWRGETTVGHPGADAGYRSAVLSMPEGRISIAVLGNVDTLDMWSLPDRILELCLGLPPEEQEQPDQETTDAVEPARRQPAQRDPRPFLGTFYSREVDTTYKLVIVDGELCAQHVRNGTIPLEITGNDRLLCERWYLSELELQRDGDGHIQGFLAHSSRSRGVQFVRREATK